MSYYIARYGRVLQYGGRMAEPPLDTSTLGFENKFEDKERAFYFRDKLREEHPRVFLRDKQSTAGTESCVPTMTMSKRNINNEEFREQMRVGLATYYDKFWENLCQLKPRDFVDGYLKALQYGFSRAPSEKELDEEQQEKKRLQEQQRKQSLIERGIELEEE